MEQHAYLKGRPIGRLFLSLRTSLPWTEIVHPGGAGAGRASLLPQRQLLAGLFRRQPHHPRGLGRGRVPCTNAGPTGDGAKSAGVRR